MMGIITMMMMYDVPILSQDYWILQRRVNKTIKQSTKNKQW